MIPETEHELAAQDGVDTRTHKPRPRMDWDIIEQEQEQKRSKKHGKL